MADTLNKFAVGCTGDHIVIGNRLAVVHPLELDEAMNLCAWLAAMLTTSGKKDELEKLYDEIMAT